MTRADYFPGNFKFPGKGPRKNIPDFPVLLHRILLQLHAKQEVQ